MLLEHDLNARAGLDLARVKTISAVIAPGGVDPQPRLFVPAHANELPGNILPDQERHLLGVDLGHLSGCPVRERTVHESALQAQNRDAGNSPRSLRIEKTTQKLFHFAGLS